MKIVLVLVVCMAQSASAYSPVNKLQHWHFYQPTKDLGRGTLGFGFGTFTHRYEEVEASMKEKNIF